MLYCPMDLGEFILVDLVDTGALSSAIREVDPRKIRILVSQSVVKASSAPDFQIMDS